MNIDSIKYSADTKIQDNFTLQATNYKPLIEDCNKLVEGFNNSLSKNEGLLRSYKASLEEAVRQLAHIRSEGDGLFLRGEIAKTKKDLWHLQSHTNGLIVGASENSKYKPFREAGKKLLNFFGICKEEQGEHGAKKVKDVKERAKKLAKEIDKVKNDFVRNFKDMALTAKFYATVDGIKFLKSIVNSFISPISFPQRGKE